jgi:hypothetical protein
VKVFKKSVGMRKPLRPPQGTALGRKQFEADYLRDFAGKNARAALRRRL